jgi:hypothetical protein
MMHNLLFHLTNAEIFSGCIYKSLLNVFTVQDEKNAETQDTIPHPLMTLLCTTRTSLYTLFAPLLHTSSVLSTFKHHWATPLPSLSWLSSCWPGMLVKARTHRSSRETSHHSPGWEECIAGPVSCTASTKEILAPYHPCIKEVLIRRPNMP